MAKIKKFKNILILNSSILWIVFILMVCFIKYIPGLLFWYLFTIIWTMQLQLSITTLIISRTIFVNNKEWQGK